MTAEQRFKKRFADVVELLCVVEAKLEQAQERVEELERELAVTTAKAD